MKQPTCFTCHRPAKWQLHQAGHHDTQLRACWLHIDKALKALLDTAQPPTPVAQIFAIVTPVKPGSQ